MGRNTCCFQNRAHTCLCCLFYCHCDEISEKNTKSSEDLFQPLILAVSVHGHLVVPLLGYGEAKHHGEGRLWWVATNLMANRKGVGEEKKGKKEGREGGRNKKKREGEMGRETKEEKGRDRC